MVECTLSITHCLRLNLQLHTIDLVRTCRISSFCTVAWQLAIFPLTRRIARSLGDSWASCSWCTSSLTGDLSLVRYGVPCIRNVSHVLFGRTFVFGLLTKKPLKIFQKPRFFSSHGISCLLALFILNRKYSYCVRQRAELCSVGLGLATSPIITYQNLSCLPKSPLLCSERTSCDFVRRAIFYPSTDQGGNKLGFYRF